MVVYVGLEAFITDCCLDLVGEFKDVDVVQIVEVLSVEASEGDHTTAHKASAVSSSWLGVVLRVSADFESLEGVALHIDDEKIVEIVTEPSCKDVNLVVVDST